MYTIKRAAELVGVSEATLRAWERRYGLGTPLRSEAGYRLYDEESLRAPAMMQALITEGWSVRMAAEEVLRRTGPAPDDADARATDTEAFVRAAAEFDATTLGSVLDRRFAAAPFESVADDWLLPTLVRLGEAWERGEVSVAAEHLAAAATGRRLTAAYDAAGASATGAGVLVGLPPRARHELGLLSFAVAARRTGLRTTWLGADVPVPDWTTAVARSRPAAVVLAAPLAEGAGELAVTVQQLLAADPGLVVAVGGTAQELAPPECVRLGHRVGPAARRLADLLATD